MGCCCDSSVLSGGWSGGVGEGRRVSSGRVKSGGPSAVQTKIGAMVTKDTRYPPPSGSLEHRCLYQDSGFLVSSKIRTLGSYTARRIQRK